MKGLIKFWTLSLGVAVAFMLTACGGGGDDAAVSLIKKEYPNAKILSFDEAKKEVGLTDKECFKEVGKRNIYFYYYFVKLDNEIKAISVTFSSEDNKPSMAGRIYSLDILKDLKPDCFN